MSFQTDINPGAPCTTFDELLEAMRTNATLTQSDAGGTWNLTNLLLTTRSSKDCFKIQYFLPSGAESDKYLYFNKAMIGVHDYAEVFDYAKLVFRDIASTETVKHTINSSWCNHVLGQFCFQGYSGGLSVGAKGPNTWGFSSTLTPSPVYAINPGILPLETTWSVKYTDKNANVPVGPGTSVNSTAITPSYTIQSPGQATTFQQDFQAFAAALVDKLVGSASEKNLATEVEDLVGAVNNLETFMTAGFAALAAALGGETGGTTVGAAVTALKNVLSAAIEAGISVKVAGISGATDVDLTALTTAVDSVSTSLDGMMSELATSLDTLADNKLVPALHDTENGLPALKSQLYDLKASLHTDLHGTLYDSVTDKSITEAVEANKPTTPTEPTNPDYGPVFSSAASGLGGILPAAVLAGAITTEQSTALVPVVGAAQTIVTEVLPAVLTVAAASPSSALVLIAGGWAVLNVFKTVLDTIKTIQDLLKDDRTDVKGHLRELLDQLVSCICQGLNSDGGPHLLRLVNAFGEINGSTGKPSATSLLEYARKAQEALNALNVTNSDGTVRSGIADILSTFQFEVRDHKGNVFFRFPA